MRGLTAQDARAMAAIHAESFDKGWDVLDMATHTQKDICLGLDDTAELAAFIILTTAAGQAEILTLATADAARRKGFGRTLLSCAETELKAKNITDVFLEVAEDNVAALALYRAAGFTPIGRRPGYYRRKEGRIAALTFSKKLA